MNSGLPTAILCDIDGTLALFGDANPYERDFDKDTPNYPITHILGLYFYHKIPIILLSGRKEKFRQVTEKWLDDERIKFNALYMRETDDNRPDYIVKKEIYDREILGKYNVLFVLDDRDQVVKLWRELGLTCLQVAYGDF